MCHTQLFSVRLVRRGAYCETGNCFVFPLRAGEPRPDMPETLRRFEVLLVGCNGGRFWGTGGGCSLAWRGSEGSDWAWIDGGVREPEVGVLLLLCCSSVLELSVVERSVRKLARDRLLNSLKFRKDGAILSFLLERRWRCWG